MTSLSFRQLVNVKIVEDECMVSNDVKISKLNEDLCGKRTLGEDEMEAIMALTELKASVCWSRGESVHRKHKKIAFSPFRKPEPKSHSLKKKATEMAPRLEWLCKKKRSSYFPGTSQDLRVNDVVFGSTTEEGAVPINENNTTGNHDMGNKTPHHRGFLAKCGTENTKEQIFTLQKPICGHHQIKSGMEVQTAEAKLPDNYQVQLDKVSAVSETAEKPVSMQAVVKSEPSIPESERSDDDSTDDEAKHDESSKDTSIKKIQRIQANRESARQTIQKKRALWEQLTVKFAELEQENQQLKQESEASKQSQSALLCRQQDLQREIEVRNQRRTPQANQQSPYQAWPYPSPFLPYFGLPPGMPPPWLQPPPSNPTMSPPFSLHGFSPLLSFHMAYAYFCRQRSTEKNPEGSHQAEPPLPFPHFPFPGTFSVPPNAMAVSPQEASVNVPSTSGALQTSTSQNAYASSNFFPPVPFPSSWMSSLPPGTSASAPKHSDCSQQYLPPSFFCTSSDGTTAAPTAASIEHKLPKPVGFGPAPPCLNPAGTAVYSPTSQEKKVDRGSPGQPERNGTFGERESEKLKGPAEAARDLETAKKVGFVSASRKVSSAATEARRRRIEAKKEKMLQRKVNSRKGTKCKTKT